jgi:hypothetical protein
MAAYFEMSLHPMLSLDLINSALQRNYHRKPELISRSTNKTGSYILSTYFNRVTVIFLFCVDGLEVINGRAFEIYAGD